MSDASDDDNRRFARPASVDDLKQLLASLKDEFVVDLMFTACGESLDTLQPHIVSIDLDGVEVRTLDLEGLLKTKQTSRAKDQLDRVVLERALQALKGRPGEG